MSIEKPIVLPNTPSIESLTEGDIYNITCLSKEDLEGVVRKIATAFEEPQFIHKEIIDTIMQGGDWRFEGTFNLKLRGNQLVFDNRNGRGVEENRLKMKKIIETL